MCLGLCKSICCGRARLEKPQGWARKNIPHITWARCQKESPFLKFVLSLKCLMTMRDRRRLGLLSLFSHHPSLLAPLQSVFRALSGFTEEGQCYFSGSSHLTSQQQHFNYCLLVELLPLASWFTLSQNLSNYPCFWISFDGLSSSTKFKCHSFSRFGSTEAQPPHPTLEYLWRQIPFPQLHMGLAVAAALLRPLPSPAFISLPHAYSNHSLAH